MKSTTGPRIVISVRPVEGLSRMGSESTVSPVLANLAIAAVFVSLLALTFAELPAAGALRAFLYDHGQHVMLVVAAVATGSSLYYSEVVGFAPCEFCWFQRIMMYPLAVLLITAAVTRSHIGSQFVFVLALIGLGLSIYHYQLQLFPSQGQVCTGSEVPCSGKYVNEFGFVTIPFMAGCGFLTILILQLSQWRVGSLYRRWSANE